MLRILIISTTLLIFTACFSNKIVVQSKKEIPQELGHNIISKIAIPVREQGYNNFKTITLSSQTELDKFINEVKEQKNWNKKENFLQSLLLNKVNFTTHSLLLYRMTESSGSTILLVEPPQGTVEHVIINIGRDKPEMGTSDMAYYALAYKFNKSVQDITFDNGLKKRIIVNKHYIYKHQ